MHACCDFFIWTMHELVVDIFQTVQLTRGTEKNMSFLLIPRSQKEEQGYWSAKFYGISGKFCWLQILCSHYIPFIFQGKGRNYEIWSFINFTKVAQYWVDLLKFECDYLQCPWDWINLELMSGSPDHFIPAFCVLLLPELRLLYPNCTFAKVGCEVWLWLKLPIHYHNCITVMSFPYCNFLLPV